MVALVPGSEPATAHFCSSPLQVPVGRPVTFTVGVPAEDVPVTRVDIEVPGTFDLHRGVEYAGWTVEREGNVVRYTGGPIGLFQCAFFTLAGEVPEKATLMVPFTTYDKDGAVIREFRSRVLNHADAAQLVYAGTEAHEPAAEEHGGNLALTVAGWALVGLGAAGALVLWVRRRRTTG